MENDPPKLSKSELAALDFIIAYSEEHGSDAKFIGSIWHSVTHVVKSIAHGVANIGDDAWNSITSAIGSAEAHAVVNFAQSAGTDLQQLVAHADQNQIPHLIAEAVMLWHQGDHHDAILKAEQAGLQGVTMLMNNIRGGDEEVDSDLQGLVDRLRGAEESLKGLSLDDLKRLRDKYGS